MNDNEHNKILVWDISIRIFHWLIVLLLLFQWFSMEVMDDWTEYHEIGGYLFLCLLIFRIVWGFIGPQYARFSNFIYHPREILAYSRTFFRSDSREYAGHNPMGGIVVIIMLLLLSLQAISGLFMTDDIFFYGPYYSVVSDEVQELMSDIHHLAFDMTVWLVSLHIIVVIYYVAFKKQSLVVSMIDGYKNVKQAQPVKNQKRILAVMVLLICSLLVYGLVDFFAPETIDYF